MRNEIDQFIEVWEREAATTARLLRSLPPDQYHFRPDSGGRSLGELAWHLAESDGYITLGIERGEYTRDARPPGIERPTTVDELAPAYERVHRDAVARIRALQPADLDRTLSFFSLGAMPVRELLWTLVLMHNIHHRGQLMLMCRLAGGTPAPVYGPRREEMPPKAVAAAS